MTSLEAFGGVYGYPFQLKLQDSAACRESEEYYDEDGQHGQRLSENRKRGMVVHVAEPLTLMLCAEKSASRNGPQVELHIISLLHLFQN